MEIKRFVTGVFETNTYLLISDKKAIYIDPAGKADKLTENLNGLELVAIVLTHGHFDHIKAVDELYDLYKVDVYLNPLDEFLARSKVHNCLMGHFATIKCPIIPINEGILKIDDFIFDVVYAPGHTQGSCILKIDNVLFVGDVLFKGSIGRTDLYGGSEKQMRQSLRLFKSFDKSLLVYPGHGPITDLETEFRENYFLKNF